MQVFVTYPNLELPVVSFTASAKSLVSDVLEEAAAEWDVDPEGVELSFAGDILCESERLTDHGVIADSEMEMWKRIVSGVQLKVAVEGSDSQKMIILSKDSTREDLVNEIRKKWSLEERFGEIPLFVSFEDEEGDKIEIDDTDCLDMYITSLEGKKGKVFVRKVPEEIETEPGETETEPETDTGKEQNADTEEEEDIFDQKFVKPKAIKMFKGHTGEIYYCCFRPSGGKQFVSASKDGSLKLWNVNSIDPIKEVRKAHESKAHESKVLSCDVSSDGSLVCSTSDHVKKNICPIKIWSASTLKHKSSLKGHLEKIYCAQFIGGPSKLASASCDKTTRVWDVDKEKATAKLTGHKENIFSLCVSDNGRMLATGADDKTIKLWDLRTNTAVQTLQAKGTVWSVAFSQDSDRLVSGTMVPSGKNASKNRLADMTIYDLRKFDVLKNQKIPESIHHVQFIKNDSYIVSCGRNRCLSFWDANDYSLLNHHELHNQHIYHASFHENRFITSSKDTTIRLWEIPDLK